MQITITRRGTCSVVFRERDEKIIQNCTATHSAVGAGNSVRADATKCKGKKKRCAFCRVSRGRWKKNKLQYCTATLVGVLIRCNEDAFVGKKSQEKSYAAIERRKKTRFVLFRGIVRGGLCFGFCFEVVSPVLVTLFLITKYQCL